MEGKVQMEKIKLKFIGARVYRSTDHVTKEPICAAPGATVDVSVEKGEQLIKDFPKEWAVAEAVRVDPLAPNVEVVGTENLDETVFKTPDPVEPQKTENLPAPTPAAAHKEKRGKWRR
jgi:hypothetical protein